jgi:nucleotide-binding universal stress UspA family protein
MFERVLVAIDQSDVSERVVAAAKELATGNKSEVWVVHLREREVLGRAKVDPAESKDSAHGAISDAVLELQNAGVNAHGQVRETLYGQAAKEIVADADEVDAGVIVMGSRGRSDLAGLVLGSVAHKVIHMSNRPVLVVR